MAQDIDVDEKLAEFGYGEKRKGMGGNIALALLLLVATAGAAFMGKMWSDEKSRLLEAERSFRDLSKKFSEMEIRNSELSLLLTDKQAELERVREEWSTQVSQMKTDHKEQLQRTFAQMNEIVYDSKKTLTYINDIESRMREGQRMDQAEAKKLAGIVNGLSFLHEQYKKPIAEFRELDRYFKRQLDALPREPGSAATPQAEVAIADPAETTPVIQRIFNNKKFKAEREAYLHEKGRVRGMAQGRATGRTEGKKEALTQAQAAVQAAYSRAQAQMDALALDKNKFLAQLDQIVQSNNQSAADVEEFFQKSKEILKIHDQIMNIEPSEVLDVRP